MTRFAVLAALVGASGLGLPQEKGEKKEEKKPEGLPIEATQKIEFTTEEGTWMSLDLSPDGNTIVFELLGDIYTMPATGGEAKRIIGGSSFDFQPRFSPDGKKIAFLSDRTGAENMYVCDTDGQNPKALTTGRNTSFLSPTWTPDGNYVIASKATGYLKPYDLWMVDVRGGTGMPAGPSASGINRMGAIVSPDGKFLYYAQRNGSWSYDAKFPLWQIYRHDLKTGETSVITNAPGSAMKPALSPDGKTLLFATRYKTATALRAKDLETGNERWVAYPIDRDEQESRATRDTLPSYAFTSDGKAVIMPLGGKIQKLDLATGNATVIPFKAQVSAEVNPTIHFEHRIDASPTVTARIIRYPTLSPDGRRMVFGAFNKLYVTDITNPKPRRLTDGNDNEFMPAWSPDGSKIVFTTWNDLGGHIYTVAADGGAPARVTGQAGYYVNPLFTPDGKQIVYFAGNVDDGFAGTLRYETHCLTPDEQPRELGSMGSNKPLDIRVIPVTGGTSKYVASAQGAYSMHFADETERLYLLGGDGISSMRLDGLDRKRHIDIKGVADPGPSSAGDIRVAPDGRSAFIELDGKLWVLTLPPAGGKVLTFTLSSAPVGIPAKMIAAEGGDYLNWTADGKAVTWSLGNRFFRQDLMAEKPTVEQVKVEMPRATPQGTVVLRNARIVTMRGNEVIAKGDLVIEGNRIVAVGKGLPAPKGAKVIDCSGKTIIPGFIDVHSHWFGPGSVRSEHSWGYLANLAYGVTTNRDPQSGDTNIYDYADLIETGQTIGPRLYTTGPGVGAWNGLADKDAVRNYIKRYSEAYDTKTLKQYVTGDRLTRQWVAMACKEFKITPTTEGALDFKMGLTEMIDGFSGHEHALPIYPFYKDIAEFMAKTKTFYAPTLLVTYGAPSGENYWYTTTDVSKDPKLTRFVPGELLNMMGRRRGTWNLAEEYGFSGVAESCARLVRAGGKVCLGSHGQLQGLGAHWELWSLQSGGMTPHEALRCATLFGAEAIGFGQDLGSLEKGKLADLIILDKNPLDDIKNTLSIRWVMKNGELFQAETLDRVWPQPKKLGPMPWQGKEPIARKR